MLAYKSFRYGVAPIVIAIGLCGAAPSQLMGEQGSNGSLGASLRDRPLRIDDVLTHEQLTTARFSDAGDAVAFSVSTNNADPAWEELWIQKGDDPAVRIMAQKSARLSAGGWSPDGRQMLVTYSARAAGETALALLEVASGKVTHCPIVGWVVAARWINDGTVLVEVLSDDERSGAVKLLPAAWKARESGAVSTASVLSSGVPSGASQTSHRSLMVIQADSGVVKLVRDGLSLSSIVISLDRRRIAYYRMTAEKQVLPSAGKALEAIDPKAPNPFGLSSYAPALPIRTWVLEVADLEGKIVMAGEPSSSTAGTEQLQWSHDSRSILMADDAGLKAGEPHLRIADVETSSIHKIDLLGLNSVGRDILWTARGGIVLSAAANRKDAIPDGRRDWYLVLLGADPKNLTSSFRTAPDRLLGNRDGTTFLGVAKGSLWQLSQDGGPWQQLVEGVSALSAVNRFDRWEDRGPWFLLERTPTPQSDSGHLVWNLESGEIDRLNTGTHGSVRAFSPRSADCLIVDESSLVETVRRVRRGHDQSTVLATKNSLMARVSELPNRRLMYRSLDGEMLAARVILPEGYQPGRKYPLLAWIYPDVDADEAFNQCAYSLRSLGWDNMQVAAAQGYAVIIPSTPIGSGLRDPLVRLASTVIPAVEQAVTEGLADPDRLFVAGHSFGGYSTYALVSQTKLFKAAVALAGPANLQSLYGTIAPGRSYGSDAAADLNSWMMWLEKSDTSAAAGMGGPPWQAFGRYWRNSPTTFVDRIETPLMMVYGDLDSVPLSQGNEMFRALQRQGKRAELVRYWGVGHILMAPANVRDLWARLFAWFDEFGKISRDEKGALVWEGKAVKVRDGAPWQPADFLRRERFFDQRSGARSGESRSHAGP